MHTQKLAQEWPQQILEFINTLLLETKKGAWNNENMEMVSSSH